MFRASMWLIPVTVLLCANSPVRAGSTLSPEVRIVAMELVEGTRVLRVGVRQRIEISAPPLDFPNPAGCSLIKDKYAGNGYAAERDLYVVDVRLANSGRSVDAQRRLLNQIYAAFATSRMVRIAVRDNACSRKGGARVAAGIQVIH